MEEVNGRVLLSRGLMRDAPIRRRGARKDFLPLDPSLLPSNLGAYRTARCIHGRPTSSHVMDSRRRSRRDSSPDIWHPEPRASGSATKRSSRDYDERRDDGSSSSSSMLAALRDFQHELRSLERRVSVMSESAAQNIETTQELLELRKPLAKCERDLDALRIASLKRFESIEERMEVLVQTNLDLSERLKVAEKTLAARAARDAELAAREREREALESSSRAYAKAKDSRSRRDSPESRADGHVRNDSGVRWPARDGELEPRSSRRRSISPARPARPRSPSPDTSRYNRAVHPAPIDSPRFIESRPPLPPLIKPKREPHDFFIIRAWAAGVPLQSTPAGALAKELSSAVQAMQEAYQEWGVPYGHAIDSALFAAKLKRIDPGIYDRNRVDAGEW